MLLKMSRLGKLTKDVCKDAINIFEKKGDLNKASMWAQVIIEMNRKGEKPVSLTSDGAKNTPQGPVDLATQENIARFDRAKKKKKKKPRKPQGQGPKNHAQ